MGNLIDGLLGLVGNVGNAMGVVGDNPQGANALQRIAQTPETQAMGQQNIQNNLANLSQDPNFQKASPADQFGMIAQKTGDTGALIRSGMMRQNQSQQQPGQTASGAQTPLGNPLNAGTYMMNLIQHESNGNPNAVGDGGQAVGLGQLHPAAAQAGGISPADRTNPVKNTQATQAYLQQQLDKYKDPYTGLLAYNWGPGNVDKWIANGADMSQVPSSAAAYPSTVSKGAVLAPKQFGGGQNAQASEPPEITQLRQSIQQAQNEKMYAPPEKWPEIDASIANATSKLAEFSPNVAGAKTTATKSAGDIQDAVKGAKAIDSRLPNTLKILDDQIALAPQTYTGDTVGASQEAYDRNVSANTGKTPPKLISQTKFRANNANLFTQELPSLIASMPGSRLDIPLVKAIKESSNIPEYGAPEEKIAAAQNLKGLLQKLQENSHEYASQISGNAPTPTSDVTQTTSATNAPITKQWNRVKGKLVLQ